MLIINLLAFIASCLVLVKSGEVLLKSLTKVSEYLKFSEFIIGFVITGISTSIPEFFVGISSAFARVTSIALGNVIGANIANLTLIIGIATLLSRGIRVREKLIKKDTWLMVVISSAPIILMIDRRLSRVDGFVLLFIFGIYLWNLLSQRREFKKAIDGVTKKDFFKGLLSAAVSILLLFISATFVVKYATLLSVDLSIPQILIGLLLVSIGTTLPELTLETRAALTHHEELAFGNVIGTIVANSTLVLGATAIIYPVSDSFLLFLTSAIFMLLVAFIFMTFVESGNRLSWKEGASLIFLYIFFVIVEFYIKGLG